MSWTSQDESEALFKGLEDEFVVPARQRFRSFDEPDEPTNPQAMKDALWQLRRADLQKKFQNRNLQMGFCSASSSFKGFIDAEEYAGAKLAQLSQSYAKLRQLSDIERPELISSAFRADIEECLRKLAELKNIPDHRQLSGANLVQALLDRKVITQDQSRLLRRLYSHLSRHIHRLEAVPAGTPALIIRYAPLVLVAIELIFQIPHIEA